MVKKKEIKSKTKQTPKKASAEAIRKKTYKLPDQHVSSSTQDKKPKSYNLLITYIVILIIGLLLGFALTSQTNCEIAKDQLSACYSGCEFSNLPSYEYNKCTLFCTITYNLDNKLNCD